MTCANPPQGADVVLLYATFPSIDEAERIGGALVDQGLAACVNIIAGMIAIYAWQGKRCRDNETVMIIKTRAELTSTVTATIRSLHPYENPAIVALPIVGGSADFLAWIASQTGSNAAASKG